MTAAREKVIVNSWNEWDPLKHVVIGRADFCCIPASEPALDAKVPGGQRHARHVRPAAAGDGRGGQRSARQLRRHPREARHQGQPADPHPVEPRHRDPRLVDRDHVRLHASTRRAADRRPRDLEATMSYRCRWFEYLAYRPILNEWFNTDQGSGGRPHPSLGSPTRTIARTT